MFVEALVCVRCGGPLGDVAQLPALVECEFCNAVISVQPGGAIFTRESTLHAKSTADLEKARVAFHDALVELLTSNREPYAALREASAAHLGTAGQTETVARVSLALARDFERACDVRVISDPIVLARIALAYLETVEKLRTAASCELNLPFLATSSAGPQHLIRELTPAIIAELAQRDPDRDAAAPPPVEATPVEATPVEAKPVKKKRWWQF